MVVLHSNPSLVEIRKLSNSLSRKFVSYAGFIMDFCIFAALLTL